MSTSESSALPGSRALLLVAMAILAFAPTARADHSGSAESNSTLVGRATGLEFAVLDSLIRRTIASGSKTRYGLKVRSVAPHSSGAIAGLRAGDIVMKVGGEPLRTVGQLERWIRSRPAGSTVEVEISRKRSVPIWSRRPWARSTVKLQLFREEDL